MTNREIVNKLFSWNCEWLTRPNYTLSELADTLYANIATVSHYKDEVFTKNVVDLLVNKVRPVKVVLQRFNRKDSSVPEEPDEHDLAALMNFVKDSTLQSLPKEMYAAADFASQCITNGDVAAEDEHGLSMWDTLTTTSSRPAGRAGTTSCYC